MPIDSIASYNSYNTLYKHCMYGTNFDYHLNNHIAIKYFTTLENFFYQNSTFFILICVSEVKYLILSNKTLT